MAFNTPTLAALISRITADFVSRLELLAPLLPKSPAGILARVYANAVHGPYGKIRDLARQLFAVTADTEYLDRHGAEYGIARKAATFAVGSVDFTGTESTVIPAGTLVQRGDGVQYATDAAGTITAGVATVAVTAVAAGVDGNAAAATAVSLVSPIAGINSAAVVSAPGMAGGADTETDDDYRARILQRKRNMPMGGALRDYERWALEVPGVTRAWPDASIIGNVLVRFVLDDDAISIFPDAAKIAEMQAYLTDATRAPPQANVTALAPGEVSVDLTIAVLPNTAAVQAAVAAEIADLFVREGVPGQTILLTHISEAISTAAGETDHDLIAPTDDIIIGAGDLPVLGTITWA